MIRRIVLENFMSHRLTTIEPAEGLTVLAGPNNCGKSAVVVALQTLCSDPQGSFMVRHGETLCRVVVETDDGHVVEWRRKGNAVSYRIDGRDIHRIRGNLPEDLHEVLRLPQVKNPDPERKEGFDIHFAEQKKPIFLLGQGRQAAIFFASSSDASLLLEMGRLHKERTKERNHEEKDLARAIEEKKGWIACLEPVGGIEDRLDALEGEGKALRGAEEAAARLGADLEAIRLRSSAAGRAAERSRALREVTAPPALAETGPIEQDILAIARLRAAIDAGEGRARALDPLAAPPELAETDHLEELIGEIERRAAGAEGARRRVGSLLDLCEPPAIDDPEPLAAHIAGIEGAEKAIEATRGVAAEAAAALEEARREIEEWARANPICPTCGAEIDPARLIERKEVHSHG